MAIIHLPARIDRQKESPEDDVRSLFTWNDCFLTHLEPVDQQHHQLIEVINDLAELTVSGQEPDQARFEAVRGALLAYVDTHFRDEETLMLEVGVDPRHVEPHRNLHAIFVQEATRLMALEPGQVEAGLQKATDHLIHWLAFHILDRDQCMARQIRDIRQGLSPQEAYALETQSGASQTEPLLQAMSGLFFMVSERNRELRALNQELEARVAARTQQLEETNRRLEALSTHDDLTGLPNRRFAHLFLQQAWLERRRHQDPLSAIMVDADHFKAVNDTFGHAQGDALIVELGRRLKAHVRASDIVCRMGGDEFLVLCPRSGRDGARLVADKLLAATTPFRTPDGVVCWDGALSLGVSEATAAMERPDELLSAADAAMYEAKHQGGHRVAG